MRLNKYLLHGRGLLEKRHESQCCDNSVGLGWETPKRPSRIIPRPFRRPSPPTPFFSSVVAFRFTAPDFHALDDPRPSVLLATTPSFRSERYDESGVTTSEPGLRLPLKARIPTWISHVRLDVCGVTKIPSHSALPSNCRRWAAASMQPFHAGGCRLRGTYIIPSLRASGLITCCGLCSRSSTMHP